MIKNIFPFNLFRGTQISRCEKCKKKYIYIPFLECNIDFPTATDKICGKCNDIL